MLFLYFSLLFDAHHSINISRACPTNMRVPRIMCFDVSLNGVYLNRVAREVWRATLLLLRGSPCGRCSCGVPLSFSLPGGTETPCWETLEHRSGRMIELEYFQFCRIQLSWNPSYNQASLPYDTESHMVPLKPHPTFYLSPYGYSSLYFGLTGTFWALALRTIWFPFCTAHLLTLGSLWNPCSFTHVVTDCGIVARFQSCFAGNSS